MQMNQTTEGRAEILEALAKRDRNLLSAAINDANGKYNSGWVFTQMKMMGFAR